MKTSNYLPNRQLQNGASVLPARPGHVDQVEQERLLHFHQFLCVLWLRDQIRYDFQHLGIFESEGRSFLDLSLFFINSLWWALVKLF